MSKDNTDFFKEKHEWSRIKDELLGSYLYPYFTKILRTKGYIYYVDCFAGAGMFDDGTKGSPLIAMDCRDKAVETSLVQGASKRIYCTFIEKKHAARLRDNVAKATQLSECVLPDIVEGTHEEMVECVLAGKKGHVVFLYVDPFGVKPLPFSVFERLANYGFSSIEMLINFNSFGFFRWACSAMRVELQPKDMRKSAYDGMDDFYFDYSNATVAKVTEVAGGQYWKRVILKYKRGELNASQAESQLVLLYKRRFLKVFKYALDIPLREKEGHMPKYRMIHLCNHYAGCKLMAEQMIKCSGRLYLKIQKDPTGDLFEESGDFLTKLHDGEYVSSEKIREDIIEVLRKIHKRVRLDEFLARYVVEKGLINDFGVIKDHLKSLSVENPYLIERESKDGIVKSSRSMTDDSKLRVYIDATRL